nr:hypothetical protein Itr_chr09CG05950 [Ipomoea trifida]
MRLDEESISIVAWRSTKSKHVSISKTRELITKTRRRIQHVFQELEKITFIVTAIDITSWLDMCHDGRT